MEDDVAYPKGFPKRGWLGISLGLSCSRDPAQSHSTLLLQGKAAWFLLLATCTYLSKGLLWLVNHVLLS